MKAIIILSQDTKYQFKNSPIYTTPITLKRTFFEFPNILRFKSIYK